MRRTVTATRAMLIIPLLLLADPGQAAGTARRATELRLTPLLGHVANNAPAAVGLLPDDVQPPIPAGGPTQNPPAGRSSAGPVAVGLVASFGLLLRRIAGRNGLPRLKPAPPRH
jgi:hypothetical protein